MAVEPATRSPNGAHCRQEWPKDRWHSAIRIQTVIRRCLATMEVSRRRQAEASEIAELHREARREEAVLRLQCWFRVCLARCRFRDCQRELEERKRLAAVTLSTPELFSAYELPAEWFDWDALLLAERQFAWRRETDDEQDAISAKAIRYRATKIATYPSAESTSFVARARQIFDAIDVRKRGTIDERYLVELHDRYGAPAVPSLHGGTAGPEDLSLRSQWCRKLVKQILLESGRAASLSRATREHAVPLHQVLDDAAPGSLNLNFDEFCTFLMRMVNE